MRNKNKIIFLASCFGVAISLTGCSNNTSRAVYESIKTQNEINKSPAERAMTPLPSYNDYQKERENMKLSD